MTAYAEVIGDPIAQSKSPTIHRFWLHKLNLDGDYRAVHVRPAELADYFARRRGDAEWLGCNVTIPHKLAALTACDVVEGAAARVGATNCVLRGAAGLRATNTDVDGVRDTLRRHDVGHICLIGNGGAARAVLAALVETPDEHSGRQVHEIRIIARDRKKSAEMLAEFKLRGSTHTIEDAKSAIAFAGLIINASPLGMTGTAKMPELILGAFSHAYPDGLAFDMVYSPLETTFLKEAKRVGLARVDGLHMLIGQAAAAFRLFFGAEAPREHDAELRALLTA